MKTPPGESIEFLLVVRPAQAGDAVAVAELSGQLGYPRTAAQAGAALEVTSARDDHAVFVAESLSGEVIGWVHVFAAVRLESGPWAEIGGLVVAASHRGQGVGRRLVREAQDWAAAAGLGSLRVRSNTARGGARRFYESMGFRRTKTQNVFVLRRTG